MMTPQHWQRLQWLAEAAAELTPEERGPWLAQECGDDINLRDEAGRMAQALAEPDLSLEEAVLNTARRAAMFSSASIGDRIGPYRVLELLGQGGMGVVYRAERADGQFEQVVALKIVSVGFGSGEGVLARFLIERQLLAGLAHPHIARLLDGGLTEAGLPYLVLEYVDGENVVSYARSRGLSVTARLELFRQVCAAVGYAHQNLIVHRDLKPGNVLVTGDGQAKLLDFGIAKLLETGSRNDTPTVAAERMMTPEYASPEQVRGGRITTATDTWGLGVLLYELLTGMTPFSLSGLSPAEAERVVCDTVPQAPSIRARGQGLALDKDLDRIVLKAMHREPERRYHSAEALAGDVSRFLGGFPVSARPDSFRYRATKFVVRHRWAVGATSLFLVTVLLLSGLLAVQARRARREAASAQAVSDYLVHLFQFARPDETRGMPVTARELLDHGTQDLHQQWKGDPLVRARLDSTLGSIYYDLGDLGHGEALLREAAATWIAHPEAEPLAVAETENALGTLLLDRGDYRQALDHYNRALDLYRRSKGAESSEMADLLDSRGSAEKGLGDFEVARRDLEESIRLHTRILGPEAAPTLLDKHNLESVYVATGDYPAGERLIREVLEAHVKTVGEDQLVTASDAGNLAYILHREGRLEESAAYSQRALGIYARMFGGDHPRAGLQWVLLGWNSRDRGDLESSRSDLLKGLGLLRKGEGDKSLNVAYAEDELGLTLLALGETERAREYLVQAAVIRQGKSAHSAALLAQSLDHEGLLLLAEGHAGEALRKAREALAETKQAYPQPNDWWALAGNDLGRVLLAGGDRDGARAAYDSALSSARASFGEKPHPVTAAALLGLGRLELAAGNRAAACRWLVQAHAMQRVLMVAAAADRVETEQALAGCTSH